MVFIFYMLIEILALAFFYYGTRKNRTIGIYVILSFTFLIILIIFRDLSVGTDYENYYNAVLRVANNNMLDYDYTWLSRGFRTFIKFIAFFGFPNDMLPFIVIGIISFFTLVLFYYSFIEFSIFPTFSLFIFFCFCLYFQMMNQFRQMFAIALVLFSYKFIDKSFWKYFFTIILAAFFHGTAVIMLPMYFICKLRISRTVILCYFFACLTGVIMYPYIMGLVRYTSYSTYLGWEEFDVSKTATAIINFIIRVFMLWICLKVRKNVISKKPKTAILYHMIIACTIIQVFAVISALFTRLTTYFYVFYILLIPEVIEEYKCYFTKESRLYFRILVVLLFLLYQIIYYAIQSEGSGYSDYKFIFATRTVTGRL